VGFSPLEHIFKPTYNFKNKEQLYGPICFAQYTLHNNKAEITAQLAPLKKLKIIAVILPIQRTGDWKTRTKRQIEAYRKSRNLKFRKLGNQRSVPTESCVENSLKKWKPIHYTTKEP